MKCLDYFIDGGKVKLALQCATNIAKLHGKHPKAVRAIGKFNAFIAKADTSKLNAEAQKQLTDFK